MPYGRAFLAIMMISGLSFSADVWKCHFGQKPMGSEGVDTAALLTLPVAGPTATYLNLGAVVPKALEFEDVLLDHDAEAQHLHQYEDDLTAGTVSPSRGSLTFVRHDAPGTYPSSVKIPLVAKVGESILPLGFEATSQWDSK